MKRKYVRTAPLKGNKYVPVSVTLTPEQIRKGKELAKQKGIKFSALIRELLQNVDSI